MELQARGLKVIRKRNGWWAQCPCPEHDDRNPSLHFHAGENVPLVVKCRSRCSQADVLKAIGPHPGWTAQPYALQLPSHHDDCLCVFHQVRLRTFLEEHGRVEEDQWDLPPELEVDVLRQVHAEQRRRTARLVALPRAHPRTTACLVLLGDFSGVGSADWRAWERSNDNPMQRRFPWEKEGGAPTPDEALVVLPVRMGKVMKLVLGDLVAITNERLIVGDMRAVPYASRWAAERLGEDDRQVRKALERLQDHKIVVKVGELPSGSQWPQGTPLYALAVRAPCPACASDIEAGPGVAGLDAQDAASPCDRQLVAQPRVEQPQVPAVAVAELDDVVGAGLATPEGGAGGLVGPTVSGHAAEQYAAEGSARLCPFEVPVGPRTEPQRTKRRREWELRRRRAPSPAIRSEMDDAGNLPTTPHGYFWAAFSRQLSSGQPSCTRGN